MNSPSRCEIQGPGDIRVLRALTRLKEKYPDRVFLILGNRDVNKLRLPSELLPERLGASSVFWDPGHTTYNEFLSEIGESEPTRTSALRWMLACTMGCSNTFETRRLELAELRGGGTTSQHVGDDAVRAPHPSSLAVAFLSR